MQVLLSRRGWDQMFASSNAFFAWRRDQPLVRVSPDAYILEAHPQQPLPRIWQTWRGHAPPLFALEVVSQDRPKEYLVNPEKYAALGATELVVYDPDDVGHKVAQKRVRRLHRYGRSLDGALTLTAQSDACVYSDVLGAFLVIDTTGPLPYLRISETPDLSGRIPTHEELAVEERAARLAVEAELDVLRAELLRLRSE